jgi:hypothetical protein
LEATTLNPAYLINYLTGAICHDDLLKELNYGKATGKVRIITSPGMGNGQPGALYEPIQMTIPLLITACSLIL